LGQRLLRESRVERAMREGSHLPAPEAGSPSPPEQGLCRLRFRGPWGISPAHTVPATATQ